MPRRTLHTPNPTTLSQSIDCSRKNTYIAPPPCPPQHRFSPFRLHRHPPTHSNEIISIRIPLASTAPVRQYASRNSQITQRFPAKLRAAYCARLSVFSLRFFAHPAASKDDPPGSAGSGPAAARQYNLDRPAHPFRFAAALRAVSQNETSAGWEERRTDWCPVFSFQAERMASILARFSSVPGERMISTLERRREGSVSPLLNHWP